MRFFQTSCVVAAALALAPGALRAEEASPPAERVATARTLTLAGAQALVDAATDEARRNNWPGAIAVVDAGGNPLLLVRMDGSPTLAGPYIALGKARSAAFFRRPTKALEDAVNEGRQALLSRPENFVLMEGGLPVTIDSEVVGAIGISADTKQHDSQIAGAAVAAFRP
jgi:glc operon protein GlcG